MTRIESDKATIAKNNCEIFNFLSDLHNLGRLMPPQVEHFTSDGETCSFDIKGMASLGMKFESKTPCSELVLARHEQKGPFDFRLICRIGPAGETASELQLFFDADLNPFLKMMAEKPLTNFLNLLLKRFQELHS